MKMKKTAILFMAVLLLVCCLHQTVFAEEKMYSEYSEWINPIWRHLPADHPFPSVEIGKSARSSILCTSYESFKSTLKQQLENRNGSFVINLVYGFQFSEVGGIVTQAFDEIMDADGYIAGNLCYRGYEYSGNNGNVDITFTITYWTTYTQEQLVTTRVQEVISQIITGSWNEEEKVKAIHDWIVLNVVYDQTLQKHSAYDALYDVKETVCQGYALLVIRMLREVNIESKYVSGYGNGGSHAWNLIYVCGNWYQMDATWDDPTWSPPRPDFIRWDYYLISDADMAVDHFWETADYPAAPKNFQAGDCDPVLPTLPTISTASVSAITQTTATCGGNITSDGGSIVTAKGVCWSTYQNPTISNSKSSNGTGTGSFTSSITGLSANTTYYVRAYATNSAGTAYGSQVSFTTSQAITIPTVTTASVTVITQNSASSGGNVTSSGGASVTARGVCWSTSQNPTTSNSKTTNGTGTGSFTSSITGLSTNTTYYVRAYAVNSAGTAYGSQIVFTSSSATVHDLSYVINILQMLSGIENSFSFNLSDDVNGDNKIGIEEAIHTLRQLAEQSISCKSFEDFETETPESLPWTYSYSGSETWSISDYYPYDGAYAAKSPTLANGGRVSMQTNLVSEGGELSFQYAQSNVSGYTQTMKFYIDNTLRYAGSSSTDYTKMSYPIGAGSHNIKWEYERSNYSTYTQTGFVMIDHICSD